MLLELNNLEGLIDQCAQLMQDNTDLIEVEESSLNKTMNNTSKICAEYGICSFPMLMVNDKLVDMHSMFTNLW